MIARRKPQVLVCAPLHDDALAVLHTVADVQITRGHMLAQADDGVEIANVDAIVVSNGIHLPVKLLERGMRLRVIGWTGSAPDAAADAAARAHGVQIVQADNCNRASMADQRSRDTELSVCEQVARILRRRYTIDSLPLQVVPVEQMVAHENFDSRRVADLADRLVADGRLVNPPIVIRQGQTYVVLDGATRLTAFRHLGYPHIVVQEVDLERTEVTLHTWHHAVHGGSSGMLVRLLSEISGLSLVVQDADDEDRLVFGDVEHPQLLANWEKVLGRFYTPDGETFQLRTAEGLPVKQWLDVLNRTVDAYSKWGTVERTLDTNLDALSEQYPSLAGLFVFPPMRLETLLDMAVAGNTMPAGITRFLIPGRMLHLNAPLDRLARAESLVEKRQWLENLLHERMVRRQVRRYEEPVVLLDE